MGRRSEKTFFKRRQRDAQQLREKMIYIMNHKGNTNKNTVTYHLILVRMTLIKRLEITSVGEKKREHLYTVGRNVN